MAIVESDSEKTTSQPLVSASTLAEMLGVHVRTVHRLKSVGVLPEAVRFGGTVRWKRSEIERWIEAGCPAENRV